MNALPLHTTDRPPGNGLRQLTDLAEALGSQWQDGTLTLPAALGQGFVRVLTPEPGLTLAIHQYRLAQVVTVTRQPEAADPASLLLSFSAFGPSAASGYLSTAQLASTTLGVTTTLPAQTAILLVALHIEQPVLAHWLRGEPTPAAGPGSQPLLLETLLTPELQAVLRQLSLPPSAAALPGFFYRIKAQELVYWLWQELAQRATPPAQPLHPADAAKIYRVRELLLADLRTAPRLLQLGLAAGLSETKLKRLFRQVFGTSPYEYYQQARLTQASRLLADHSVAEAGYQVGFTNLSHFARLFQRQFGLTPKKYQARTS